MISYIKGELVDVTDEGTVVVETGDIGYNVMVPASLLSELPAIGCEVKLYTYLHVREDAMQLYGFFSRDERRVFKLVLGVSGIGPKGALGILGTISPDDLRFAVLSDDVKAISKAPGIGTKTAQKLIIELKDKLSLEEAFELKSAHVAEAAAAANDSKDETVQALVALGYSPAESLKAVKQIDWTEDMTVEAALKLALKKLAFV